MQPIAALRGSGSPPEMDTTEEFTGEFDQQGRPILAIAARDGRWRCPDHDTRCLVSLSGRAGRPYRLCGVPGCEEWERQESG